MCSRPSSNCVLLRILASRTSEESPIETHNRDVHQEIDREYNGASLTIFKSTRNVCHGERQRRDGQEKINTPSLHLLIFHNPTYEITINVLQSSSYAIIMAGCRLENTNASSTDAASAVTRSLTKKGKAGICNNVNTMHRIVTEVVRGHTSGCCGMSDPFDHLQTRIMRIPQFREHLERDIALPHVKGSRLLVVWILCQGSQGFDLNKLNALLLQV
jgi:hypothetical protein